jgi:hypothetical protein
MKLTTRRSSAPTNEATWSSCDVTLAIPATLAWGASWMASRGSAKARGGLRPEYSPERH